MSYPFQRRVVGTTSDRTGSAPDQPFKLCRPDCDRRVGSIVRTDDDVRDVAARGVTHVFLQSSQNEAEDTRRQGIEMGLDPNTTAECAARMQQALGPSLARIIDGLTAPREVTCRGPVPLLGCTARIEPLDETPPSC